jgi:serine/threonine-protein kinase RsbW
MLRAMSGPPANIPRRQSKRGLGGVGFKEANGVSCRASGTPGARLEAPAGGAPQQGFCAAAAECLMRRRERRGPATALSLSLHVTTHPDAIRFARKLLYAAARIRGAPEQDARDIELAVGEALTNVRRHAYQDGIGPAEVAIDCHDSGLTVIVRDWGIAGAPPAVPGSLSLESNSGGRGLYLISRLMQRVEILQNPEGWGVTLRMAKQFGARD